MVAHPGTGNNDDSDRRNKEKQPSETELKQSVEMDMIIEVN